MKSIYLNFEKMKNVDHRKTSREKKVKKANRSSEYCGWRVRQLDVERNFPKTEVVIKRVHGINKVKKLSAKEEIKEMKLIVRKHNNHYNPKTYKLLEPVAYAIGGRLVAMPKINAPSGAEIENIVAPQKKSSLIKLEKPTRRASKAVRELEKKGITKVQIAKAIKEVESQSEIWAGNLWLLGHEKGKFIFMSFIDTY